MSWGDFHMHTKKYKNIYIYFQYFWSVLEVTESLSDAQIGHL